MQAQLRTQTQAQIQAQPQKKRLRVLCVDDDSTVLAYFHQALGPSFDTFEAKSGREGMKALIRERFDWVVLDYNLGDMNGGQFLFSAYRRGLRPGYILVSSFSLRRLDWEGLRPLGVMGCMKKPLDGEFLKALIETGGRIKGAPVGDVLNRFRASIREPEEHI